MIKSEIMSALKSKGMYTVDPDSATGYWGMGFLLVTAALRGFCRCLALADFLSSSSCCAICAA